MFLVPMDAPGVRVVPMNLLSEHNINYTFYEDVRVPASASWAARTRAGS